MTARIELIALLALAGCTAAPKANRADAKLSAAEADDLAFLKGVAWARKYCANYAGDISEHPEADARADFARGERHGVGYENLNTYTPGGAYSEHCPIGGPGMRRIKGLDGDVATCLGLVGTTYVERYNRELMRLCGPAPASRH